MDTWEVFVNKVYIHVNDQTTTKQLIYLQAKIKELLRYRERET